MRTVFDQLIGAVDAPRQPTEGVAVRVGTNEAARLGDAPAAELPSTCLSGVEMVLEWCWSGVGVVLEWCWSGVGKVLKWC